MLDQQLFLWINGLHIPLFDELSPYYRHKLFWIPLYVFLFGYLTLNFGRRGWWAIVFAFMTFGISDTASSQWIKKSVQRLRPCNTVELQERMVERVRCGGGYSFTSSHATNHGAVAMYLFLILSFLRKRWRGLLLLWAASIALAQVYVGVHYPLDIAAGLLLGGAIGWVTSSVYNRYVGLKRVEVDLSGA